MAAIFPIASVIVVYFLFRILSTAAVAIADSHVLIHLKKVILGKNLRIKLEKWWYLTAKCV